MEKPKIYSCKCMSFSGRFPLISGEIGGFLLFQYSTCLIYHLFVVLTSQVVNCNAYASPLHCSKQLLYNLWFLVSWQRLVDRRRGISLFGVPPFLAPLHFFSFVLLCSITSTWKGLFSIYIFNSFLLTLCSLLHPIILSVLSALKFSFLITSLNYSIYFHFSSFLTVVLNSLWNGAWSSPCCLWPKTQFS